MNTPQRKPEWLKNTQTRNQDFHQVSQLVKNLHLHTVCEEANCPNRTECYSHRTATFLILGAICTRKCKFCNVSKGTPLALDPAEPFHLAQACKSLNLKHAVITSVTRDDLPDGGAGQFAQCIQEIRQLHPSCTIEVLTPDFSGSSEAIQVVIDAHPEVYNHNIETVARLYPLVRPIADYHRSLKLLAQVKQSDPFILSKSGIMVGLGETAEEVEQTLQDLHAHGCDALTIGQYLPPSKEHYPLAEYITPAQFEVYRQMALHIGFKQVASSPLTRSSYHASLMLQENHKED